MPEPKPLYVKYEKLLSRQKKVIGLLDLPYQGLSDKKVIALVSRQSKALLALMESTDKFLTANQ